MSPSPHWRAWPAGAVLDELVEHVPRAGVERRAALAGRDRRTARRDAARGRPRRRRRRTPARRTRSSLADDPSDPDGRLDPTAQRLFLALDGAVPRRDAAARVALEAGDASVGDRRRRSGGRRNVAAEWLGWVGRLARCRRRLDDDPPRAPLPAALRPRRRRRRAARDGVRVRRGALAPLRVARGRHGRARRRREPARRSIRQPTSCSRRRCATRACRPTATGSSRRAAVDVSAIEAQPHDLARLCLAEFALVSGDDWLVDPVDGSSGPSTRSRLVAVTTTFGETIAIDEAGDGPPSTRLPDVRGHDRCRRVAARASCCRPIAARPLLGEPVEEIAFVRDETANMGWAVERVVPGPQWRPAARARPSRRRCGPPPPEDLDPERRAVRAPGARCPKHWIPLVPVRTAPGVVGLRKGAMLDDGEPVLAGESAARADTTDLPARGDPARGDHRPRRAGARAASRRHVCPLDRPSDPRPGAARAAAAMRPMRRCQRGGQGFELSNSPVCRGAASGEQGVVDRGLLSIKYTYSRTRSGLVGLGCDPRAARCLGDSPFVMDINSPRRVVSAPPGEADHPGYQ